MIPFQFDATGIDRLLRSARNRAAAPTSETSPVRPLRPYPGAESEAHIGVVRQPLRLLHEAAIARLHEVLAPELGARAFERSAAGGSDFSPDAVAERILGFVGGHFKAYRERHADAQPEHALDGFVTLAKGAIDTGLAEARTILAGLQVLSGTIRRDVDRTDALITGGLARFEADQRERLAAR